MKLKVSQFQNGGSFFSESAILLHLCLFHHRSLGAQMVCQAPGSEADLKSISTAPRLVAYYTSRSALCQKCSFIFGFPEACRTPLREHAPHLAMSISIFEISISVFLSQFSPISVMSRQAEPSPTECYCVILQMKHLSSRDELIGCRNDQRSQGVVWLRSRKVLQQRCQA